MEKCGKHGVPPICGQCLKEKRLAALPRSPLYWVEEEPIVLIEKESDEQCLVCQLDENRPFANYPLMRLKQKEVLSKADRVKLEKLMQLVLHNGVLFFPREALKGETDPNGPGVQCCRECKNTVVSFENGSIRCYVNGGRCKSYVCVCGYCLCGDDGVNWLHQHFDNSGLKKPMTLLLRSRYVRVAKYLVATGHVVRPEDPHPKLVLFRIK